MFSYLSIHSTPVNLCFAGLYFCPITCFFLQFGLTSWFLKPIRRDVSASTWNQLVFQRETLINDLPITFCIFSTSRKSSPWMSMLVISVSVHTFYFKEDLGKAIWYELQLTKSSAPFRCSKILAREQGREGPVLAIFPSLDLPASRRGM